ncbi:tyrosine protein phosphatase 1 [Orobanche hederae]
MANTTAAAAEPFDITAVLMAEIAPLSEDQLRCCSDAVAFFEEKMSSLQTIHNEFEILQKLSLIMRKLLMGRFRHKNVIYPASFFECPATIVEAAMVEYTIVNKDRQIIVTSARSLRSCHFLFCTFSTSIDWPDHGVPNDTAAVRDIFRITSAIPASLGPIVVHCSAVLDQYVFCYEAILAELKSLMP